MTNVKIERISNFEYTFRESDSNGKRTVAKALTFRNPNIYAFDSKIEMFDKKNFTFKIGMLSNIQEYCEGRKVNLELFDYEYPKISETDIDDRLKGKYQHQADAVKEFFQRRFGILKVPTRGGKTFFASEVIRLFLASDSGNFLFIVDTQDLFNQAKSDIKKFFEPYGGIDIGEISQGTVETNRRVTIGMIQTIQSIMTDPTSKRAKKSTRKKSTDPKVILAHKTNRKNLVKYIHELVFLCVDEIHDNCSDSKLKIYKKAKNIEYLLCLSATPYRTETLVQNLKLQSWSGGIFYEITEELLRERKVLSDYRVIMFLVDHNEIDYVFEVEDYADIRKKLVLENKIRDEILVNVIKILDALKLKTLVLFQSVEHGNRISSLTGITFISGLTKIEDRATAKEIFLKGRGKTLLASGIFKKGITLPSAQVLINADGGLEDANTIQRCGRVLGITEEKKKSLIIDFFDLYDMYFSQHSETRLNNYVNRIGENRVGILDISADDFYKTFEKWTKKWML